MLEATVSVAEQPVPDSVDCPACDGEGVVEINRHGHTSACEACRVAVRDDLGRVLWHERRAA